MSRSEPRAGAVLLLVGAAIGATVALARNLMARTGAFEFLQQTLQLQGIIGSPSYLSVSPPREARLRDPGLSADLVLRQAVLDHQPLNDF